MTHELTLNLDEFGRSALDRLARRTRGSASAAVTTASLYYLADGESGRPAWGIPRFRADTDGHAGGRRVDLDDKTWQALSDEADRQGVTPELLARHALLYFLADVDSGRVGALLDDALELP